MAADRVPFSRRAFLGGTAAGLASLLAGCSDGAASGGSGDAPVDTSSTDGAADDVFEALAFDGPNLVVTLADGHSVDRVNLVSPDGSLFASRHVAAGVTTVRIPILRIEPADHLHYTPGIHELVAVSGQETVSRTIEMRPDVRIVDVRQYTEGDSPFSDGMLAVEVENVGTGPTWVYDITYRGSPNFAAEDPIGSDPGIASFVIPRDAELVIPPGGSKTYVRGSMPFQFTDSRGDGESCPRRIFELDIIAVVATGKVIELPLVATIDGNPSSTGMTGQFVCSEVDIEFRVEQ